jgi:ATP-binding cassette subfamily F protein uup
LRRRQCVLIRISKAKKLLSKELEWVRRQPKARGTKAKSRVDSFHKLDEHVSSITYDEIFQIDVDTARLGKKIVEFYDASKSFGDKKMLEGFWYKFKKGERVGISGANGTGKSTFIKLITGEERLTTGKRVIGETVLFGHYHQDGIQLDQDKRVIDVIRSYGEYIPLKKGQKLSAARLLETFMFPPFQHQVYVSQLSGGERKRLHLLCVLMGNPNFLILDEPTNDLDVLTLNVLEDYLSQFPGCLVIISHDRFFMDKLVDHMFIFKGEGDIKDFNGTYSEWKRSQTNYSSNSSEAGIQATKETIGEQAEEATQRKLSYKEKMEMKSLEKEIDTLDKRRKEIEDLFIQGSLDNSQIKELSIELGTIKTQTDEKEFRWLELSEIEG